MRVRTMLNKPNEPTPKTTTCATQKFLKPTASDIFKLTRMAPSGFRMDQTRPELKTTKDVTTESKRTKTRIPGADRTTSLAVPSSIPTLQAYRWANRRDLKRRLPGNPTAEEEALCIARSSFALRARGTHGAGARKVSQTDGRYGQFCCSGNQEPLKKEGPNRICKPREVQRHLGRIEVALRDLVSALSQSCDGIVYKSIGGITLTRQLGCDVHDPSTIGGR